ncbi:MAG: UDP-3-O-(3-hydroxymyristoyl)glucosamine N-acyltransferase [Eubacterium sp.]
MKMQIEMACILDYLTSIKEDYTFFGREDAHIMGYSSIFNYEKGSMTWIRNGDNLEKSTVNPEEIKLIILPYSYKTPYEFQNYICTEDSHRLFFRLLQKFFVSEVTYAIGKNCNISESAKIAEYVSIGNNCTISDHVTIGEGTRIYHNVVIAENVCIGKNCTIKSGAIIGEEGFGFMKDKNGINFRVPHLGKIIIGNYVDIGANTCIDRGVMEDTVIKDHAKIDNLCHIAHNTAIGENTIVVALTLVGGSTKIGNHCWIGTSTIRNLLEIGDEAFIGIGSNVVSNIAKKALVYGNPAKEKKP